MRILFSFSPFLYVPNNPGTVGSCDLIYVNRFTVEADRSIRDLTIITEYVGDVDFLKNREHDDGDSMMTLLTAKDPSKSLVICPDKCSNIARFINGINNHTPYVKLLPLYIILTRNKFVFAHMIKLSSDAGAEERNEM